VNRYAQTVLLHRLAANPNFGPLSPPANPLQAPFLWASDPVLVAAKNNMENGQKSSCVCPVEYPLVPGLIEAVNIV